MSGARAPDGTGAPGRPAGSALAPPGRRRELAAVGALLAVCVCWGSTFVVVKSATARMPVTDFLAWRFGLGAAAMVLLRPRAVLRLGRRGLSRGALLGLVLGAGYLTQTYGLRTTPASVSGFITGMLVVFTPLCAWLLLRRPVGALSWAAVAIATAGLALIALRGVAVGAGEALTLACALCFALHVVGLGEWAAEHDPFALAVVQLATVCLVCLGPAAAGSSVAPPGSAGVWGAVLLTAVAATALAFLVQTWAQRHLPPTRAAVVMTTEPVFAGVFGVLVGGDRLDARAVAGAVLVVGAMVLTEAGPRHGAEGRLQRLEV